MLNFALGIVAMSMFSFLSALIFDKAEDGDLKECMMGGPIMWLCVSIVYLIIKPIRQIIKYHNKKSIIYNIETNSYYYCSPKYFGYFYHGSPWKCANGQKFTDFINQWPDCRKIKVTNTKHVSKKIWKRLEAVPVEVIDAFKQVD